MWTGAAIIPAITGLCRYGAGKHFFTDVIVGYAIGSAIGIGIPQLHKIKQKKD
ncbi:MAG: phosphatase PAP2 family protein [Chitinophagales bacterium]